MGREITKISISDTTSSTVLCCTWHVEAAIEKVRYLFFDKRA